jgi:uncharacterized protein (TIGR03435 family)
MGAAFLDSDFERCFASTVAPFGLKLQPKKVPLEIIVVDHMEKMPTGN